MCKNGYGGGDELSYWILRQLQSMSTVWHRHLVIYAHFLWLVLCMLWCIFNILDSMRCTHTHIHISHKRIDWWFDRMLSYKSLHALTHYNRLVSDSRRSTRIWWGHWNCIVASYSSTADCTSSTIASTTDSSEASSRTTFSRKWWDVVYIFQVGHNFLSN